MKCARSARSACLTHSSSLFGGALSNKETGEKNDYIISPRCCIKTFLRSWFIRIGRYLHTCSVYTTLHPTACRLLVNTNAPVGKRWPTNALMRKQRKNPWPFTPRHAHDWRSRAPPFFIIAINISTATVKQLSKLLFFDDTKRYSSIRILATLGIIRRILYFNDNHEWINRYSCGEPSFDV